ncbi:cyclic nucleotide-binding-like protein, partial [Ochromonadaceae sp. CCMP2298]
MEEIFYVKGDDIIQQDDIGESFFVLEEGEVTVTQSMRDYMEAPRPLATLSRNAHFGEISLLTAEPRSATVTVISANAKCLRMTKQKFEELLATTNKLHAKNRLLIGKDVLDTVPLFRSLTAGNRKKLLEAMTPMTYLPASYICRQGTTGNSFFILTDGHCAVSVNEDRGEREVGMLRAGDYFGGKYVALMESSSRRTANVVSIDAVSCLSLNRNDF